MGFGLLGCALVAMQAIGSPSPAEGEDQPEGEAVCEWIGRAKTIASERPAPYHSVVAELSAARCGKSRPADAEACLFELLRDDLAADSERSIAMSLGCRPDAKLREASTVRLFEKPAASCMAMVSDCCFLAALLVDLGRFCAGDKATKSAKAARSLIQAFDGYRSADGFGKTRWGMTVKEVRSKVPGATVVEDGNLAAKADVGRFKGVAYYSFASGRLVAVTLVVPSDSFHPEIAVGRFGEIATLLDEKYGSGEDTSHAASDAPIEDVYRHVGGNGRAVRAGALILSSKRERESTSIHHQLSGDGSDQVHLLQYRSKVLWGVFMEQVKARLLRGL